MSEVKIKNSFGDFLKIALSGDTDKLREIVESDDFKEDRKSKDMHQEGTTHG